MADLRELMGGLTAALEEKVAALEERSNQVKRKREELEKERRMMSSLPRGTDAGTEIVEINVGGEIFQTKRATLLAADGSLLAAMFSGRWEESLDRDKEGRVFFDFDPAHFRILLNHLRLARISTPEKNQGGRTLAEPPEHKELFEATVNFLGMREFLYGGTTCDAAALECAQVGTQDGTISIDGNRISGGTGLRHRVAIGKAPLLRTAQASAAWKVSITKLDQGGWFFAGVIGNPSPGVNSYYDATSCGWSPYKTWKAGRESQTGCALQQGDCAVFQLDGVGKRLRMFLERTGQSYDIHLGDGIAAHTRLHLNLYHPGTEVVVSPASADEVRRAGF